MKVSIVKGGGFAGMTKTTTCDSAALPAEQVATLEAMVKQAGLFDLPKDREQTKQPDRFNYELTIEDGDKNHIVRLAEEDLSPDVRSLIDWVNSSPGSEVSIGPPGGAGP